MEVREPYCPTMTSRATRSRLLRVPLSSALEGDQSPIGEPAILALAKQLDSYIPTPERADGPAVPYADRRRVLDLSAVVRL